MSVATDRRPQHGVIDPRFRRRRIEVLTTARRRRLRRVLVVLGLLGLVVLGIIVVRSPLFDLDEIDVTGLGRTERAAVIAASGLTQGTPLMDTDIGRAEREVASLPWVFTVDVRRVWPDSVIIDIVERQPAAAMKSNAGYVVVDQFGHVVERPVDRPLDLPVIGVDPGPVSIGDSVPEAVDGARTAAAMPSEIWAWVLRVETDEELGVVLALVDDARVLVGDSSALRDKFVALSTILTRAELICVDRIDVRVPQTPVLTRRPGCS